MIWENDGHGGFYSTTPAGKYEILQSFSKWLCEFNSQPLEKLETSSESAKKRCERHYQRKIKKLNL